VWRAETGHPVQYPVDPYIVAVATDTPAGLPESTGLPLLDVDDAEAVAAFLLSDPNRYEYTFPDFPPAAPVAG
jgi:molybdopterin-guanine dinucleotide biosynthesis protein B